MSALEICPVCKRPKKDWKGNEGKGVRKNSITYCCEGCVSGTGCVCELSGARPKTNITDAVTNPAHMFRHPLE